MAEQKQQQQQQAGAAAPTKQRKKVRKNVLEGIAHVHASFNNTIVTITDRQGNTLSCLSCHSMHSSAPDDQLAARMEGDDACFQCHAEYRERVAEHTQEHAVCCAGGSGKGGHSRAGTRREERRGAGHGPWSRSRVGRASAECLRPEDHAH